MTGPIQTGPRRALLVTYQILRVYNHTTSPVNVEKNFTHRFFFFYYFLVPCFFFKFLIRRTVIILIARHHADKSNSSYFQATMAFAAARCEMHTVIIIITKYTFYARHNLIPCRRHRHLYRQIPRYIVVHSAIVTDQ